MINKKENYARFYSKSLEHAYGKPNSIVEAIPHFIPTGDALDLGAGDGRHSIFLAARGFHVKAIDTSDVALEKMNRIASEKGVSVETVLADIAHWSFDKEYDVIVATAIFQHMLAADATRILNQMKAYTRPNGINAISIFTNNGDRYLLDRESDPEAFYPPDGWLKTFYDDWEIKEYSETEVPLIEKFREDGTPMTNIVAKILAKKPGSTA